MSQSIADELGLGYANMMATQGKLCGEKFVEVFDTFQRSDIDNSVFEMMASQLSTWFLIFGLFKKLIFIVIIGELLYKLKFVKKSLVKMSI